MDAGFLAVSVKKKVTFVDDTKAEVGIDVDEGPQTKTGTVDLRRGYGFHRSRPSRYCESQPGAPYNERLVDEDRYRILSAYSK